MVALILIYFLTTAGFFKSALEECADIDIRNASQFNKNGIYKDIEMTDAEKLVAKKYWVKRDKEYKLKKKNKTIVGYGATAKATTVLNYCNIDEKIIDFFIEGKGSMLSPIDSSVFYANLK